VCVEGGFLTGWAGLFSMEYTMEKLVYSELKHRRYYELNVQWDYASDALVPYNAAPVYIR